MLDERIPAWDPNDLHARACPLCGGAAQPRYRRPDALTVATCARCGLQFVAPAPSQAQLDRFYEDYDASHRLLPGVTPEALARVYANADPLGDVRLRELATLMDFRGARVLDVGFGRAHLLAMSGRLGAETAGVDPDPRAVELARGVGIKNVRRGTIDAVPNDARFDLVLLNDVIEHPLEPMRMLRRAAGLLAPGGLLSIWTPNGEAPDGGSAPVVFRVDLEHMQYFTARSCARIARVLSLDVVHLETLGYPGGAASPRSKPPTRAARVVRRLLRRKRTKPDPRSGSYHLFCVLRKARS